MKKATLLLLALVVCATASSKTVDKPYVDVGENKEFIYFVDLSLGNIESNLNRVYNALLTCFSEFSAQDCEASRAQLGRTVNQANSLFQLTQSRIELYNTTNPSNSVSVLPMLALKDLLKSLNQIATHTLDLFPESWPEPNWYPILNRIIDLVGTVKGEEGESSIWNRLSKAKTIIRSLKSDYKRFTVNSMDECHVDTLGKFIAEKIPAKNIDMPSEIFCTTFAQYLTSLIDNPTLPFNEMLQRDWVFKATEKGSYPMFFLANAQQITFDLSSMAKEYYLPFNSIKITLDARNVRFEKNSEDISLCWPQHEIVAERFFEHFELKNSESSYYVDDKYLYECLMVDCHESQKGWDKCQFFTAHSSGMYFLTYNITANS